MKNPSLICSNPNCRLEDTYQFIFEKQITKSDIDKFIFPEREAKVHFPCLPLDQSVDFRVRKLDDVGELQIKSNTETHFINNNMQWVVYVGLNSIKEGDSLMFYKLNKDLPPYGVRLEKKGESIELGGIRSAENSSGSFNRHPTESEIREKEKYICIKKEDYECIFEKRLTATNVGKMLNIPVGKTQHFPHLTDIKKKYELQVYDFDQKRIWYWDVRWDCNCWTLTKNWKFYIKTHLLDERDSVQFFKLKQSQSENDSQPLYAITYKKKLGTSAPNTGGDEAVTAKEIGSDGKGESAQAPDQANESDGSGKKPKLTTESTNRTHSAESDT